MQFVPTNSWFLCQVYKSKDYNNVNLLYRWFSRYVIAAMLVDGKQKIAH